MDTVRAPANGSYQASNIRFANSSSLSTVHAGLPYIQQPHPSYRRPILPPILAGLQLVRFAKGFWVTGFGFGFIAGNYKLPYRAVVLTFTIGRNEDKKRFWSGEEVVVLGYALSRHRIIKDLAYCDGKGRHIIDHVWSGERRPEVTTSLASYWPL
ncbi:hypothetical protein P154DRAFT_164620 [Amniculicola lignicola CBS 123094]|uniref:Uncharacterized protein n=1 Tax=Amniculicola lignicola CBS 123094 TaxID=1392246 RepID=A0A6A5WI68_9PLEO|nr:hypothetical protein P154DRAFT_164620 [Amniculicola lignicola CBS 123094]